MCRTVEEVVEDAVLQRGGGVLLKERQNRRAPCPGPRRPCDLQCGVHTSLGTQRWSPPPKRPAPRSAFPRRGLSERLLMTVAVPFLWGVPPELETVCNAVRRRRSLKLLRAPGPPGRARGRSPRCRSVIAGRHGRWHRRKNLPGMGNLPHELTAIRCSVFLSFCRGGRVPFTRAPFVHYEPSALAHFVL